MHYRIFVTILLIALLTLAACAVPAPPEGALETTMQGQEANSGTSVAMKIEFWTLLTGNLARALDQQVQAFNQSQDKIQIVNVNQGGYQELQQKLLAAVAAGNPPVITMVDYINVPFYAQQGVFEPINNLASEEDMADFIPALLDDLSYKGQVYALPYNRSTQGLYYNKDLFAEIGLDPERAPETWDEFRQFSKQITESAEGRYGTYANFTRWYFEPFIYQWGGRMNDEECNPVFHKEGAVEVMTFFRNLYQDGYATLPSNLSGTFDQQALEFVNGDVGMMLQSTAIQSFIGDTVDFTWGFSMLPAGPAGRAVTHGGGNVAISAKASDEEKQAAWEFVRFLTDAERSAEFHMATGYMPTRYSVLEMPEVQAFHKENPSWLVSVKQLEFARPTACVVVNVPEYHNIITEAIARVIINGEDPEAVMNEAASELQAAIDTLRAEGKLIQ